MAIPGDLYKKWIDYIDSVSLDIQTIKNNLGKVISAIVTLLASGDRTASGAGDPVIGLGVYREGYVILNVTAASGTTPTLDVIIQTSPDEGVTWENFVTFAQKIAVGIETKRFSSYQAVAAGAGPFGDQMKVVYTIGGTTPSFTFSVKGMFKS